MLNRLLGIEENKESKKGTADSGKNWSVEEILRHCTLENGLLKLPNVQFNKKSYAEAKKWIEEAGGSWQGGKAQGFTFPFNPERVFSILKEGKRCNLQQEYQFFETPAEVADWLVMLAGGIHENDTVLEPSAGRGALIKAIHRACPSVTVECYELMPENREFLYTLSNVILLDEDFTKDSVGSYTKIIANPPFSDPVYFGIDKTAHSEGAGNSQRCIRKPSAPCSDSQAERNHAADHRELSASCLERKIYQDQIYYAASCRPGSFVCILL